MAKKTGIEAATRQAMTNPPAVPAPGGGQASLFPEEAEAIAAGGPGRPQGAQSKRTRDFLAYLDKRPDLQLPGVWLAKRYSKEVSEVLTDCGLSDTAENRKWTDGQRQDAAKALAPYVHERRPMGLEVDDRRTMEVTVRALDVDGNEVVIDHDSMNLNRLLMGGDDD